VRVGIHRFGSFELDTAAFELRLDGSPVRLEKIPLELLILLVERSDQLVSRADIAERLWGDRVHVAAEQGINTAVRKLRQALGDDPEHPRMLQTVVGKGYRFIAPIVAPVTTELPPSAPIEPAASARVAGSRPSARMAGTRRVPARLLLAVAAVVVALAALASLLPSRGGSRVRAIAVLPLENLGDPSQQFFADGITDALITRVARLRDVRVISRTSSMHYLGSRLALADIARELGVDAVVEGTVLRAGNRVRITAQLIDTRRESHLWADEYERDLGDILGVQADVADAIARAVRTTIIERGSSPARVEPVAYEHYLRGRSYWNQRTPRGLATALDEFEQAVTVDPKYGEALAGLADTYTALGYGSYWRPGEAFPNARDAATRALAMDGSLAEAQASLGYVALYYDWNWSGAEAAFTRAIAANPNYATAHHWYSVCLTALGRHAEAAREIARARELDPLSAPIATDIGFELYYARRYDEAIVQLRKVLASSPAFAPARLWLGRCYEARGLYDQAIAEFRQASAALDDWPVAVAATGHALGRAGRTAEARAVLAQLDNMARSRFVTSYGVAVVHAGLGDRSAALDWLERAAAERSHWLVWLPLDPRFDELRSEPRFQAVLARLHQAR
jgi:TolB-like protein/DNA-binding winged helix-turn-helix (wHTH) protein/Tfp pilus assembly protein PilF